MKKFVLEYALQYTHLSRFGVEATDAEAAERAAREAIENGDLGTVALPLLSDEWEQLDDGACTLAVRCECPEGFPEPDQSALRVGADEKARAVCIALVKAYRDGKEVEEIDWDVIDQIHELACDVLGADPNGEEEYAAAENAH